MIHIVFSLLSGLGGFLIGLTVFFANDYFFDSGRRAPTALDFFILASLLIFPLTALIKGFAYAKRNQLEITSTAFVLVTITVLLFTLSSGYLYKKIENRTNGPLPQNSTVATSLTNTSWAREDLSDADWELLKKARPNQIIKLSFLSDPLSQCDNNQSYVVEFASGEIYQSCWRINKEGGVLVLQEPDLSSTYYNNFTFTETTLVFSSAGQTWKFQKIRKDYTTKARY